MIVLLKLTVPFFNYDLISICETSSDDTVELPETLLNGYTFVSANNSANSSIRILFQSLSVTICHLKNRL